MSETPILIAIDTETLPSGDLWCVSLSTSPGTAWVTQDLATLSQLLRSLVDDGENIQVIYHNSFYDHPKLQDVVSPSIPIDDTMVMARLLQLESTGLKNLATRLCGMTMTEYDDVVKPEQRRISLDYLYSAREIASRPDFPSCDPRWVEDTVDGRVGIVLRKPTPLSRVNKQGRDTGRIARLIADLEADKRGKDGSRIDPLKRWREWGEDTAPIEVELGEHPQACLADVDPDRATRYAARDADATFRIYPILRSEIEHNGLERAYQIDMAAIPMVARMLYVGIAVDREHLARAADDLRDRTLNVRDQCWTEAGTPFNPASDTQVRDVLFRQRGLEIRGWTDSGLPSTQDDYLLPLQNADPLVNLVVQYRRLSKLRDTYALPLLRMSARDGRIHASAGMTVNNRFALRDPNLMAIPQRSKESKLIKDGFVAFPGKVLVYADASQIEMRVLAHVSQDTEMLNIFRTGRDTHTETAVAIFGCTEAEARTDWYRLPAKRTGFGIVYGIQGYGLFIQLDQEVPGRYRESDCESWIRSYLDARPGVKRYMDLAASAARRTGETRDMFGYRRLVLAAQSRREEVRGGAEREAINFPISSGALGVIKIAMALLWYDLTAGDWSGLGIEPLLQLHDALVFEAPLDVAPAWRQRVLERLEEAGKLAGISVPITGIGKIGRSLGELAE